MQAIEQRTGRMHSESTAWRIVGLTIALLAIAVPAYVAYDTDDPPAPNPEKRLELINLPAINPLKDLSALRDKATISVTVGDETFDNLLIAEALFENKGDVPILPDEYHQNLTVTVDAPWKIVTVENQGRFSFGTSIPLNWRRINDTSFEAEPALLNPGDEVYARVYLINTQPPDVAAAPGKKIGPEVKWNVRITNLRGFSKPPNRIPDMETMLDMKGIIIILYGWAVPFVIVVAIFVQSAYLYLVWRLGLLREWKWKSFGLLIGISLLSFMASESIATYLFENWWTAVAGVDHLANLPPFVLNTAFVVFLWWKARPKSEKAALIKAG